MSLRPKVLEAKQRLAEGRAKLKARHDKGSPGIQVCRALTELFDSLVMMLFDAAIEDLGENRPDGLRSSIALVPHGGYGRGDVAPHSDVDLMMLYDSSMQRRVAPLAERLVRDVFDVGLTLGQSIRTPSEACQLARSDPAVCTSLIESRFLSGSEEVYSRFTRSFQADVKSRRWSILNSIERARSVEREQFGETVYLLEPNVKRSPGGLRDMQLLRWIGFVRYGAADPDGLRLVGVLSDEDHDVILRAHEFLLRLRNELHFHTDKPIDVLDRVEQVRIAELFGYTGTAGLLPVEQFMREYFRMTHGVSQVTRRFAANARPDRDCARFSHRCSAISSKATFASIRGTSRSPNAVSRNSAAISSRSSASPTWRTCTTSRSRTKLTRPFARRCRNSPIKSPPRPVRGFSRC